jgi:hypothetical protein
MNDANGGEGNLHGIVENVPLNCGGVMTHANLYVGTHVPFDLLLGRPWQRGNFVSIDERRDRTYLLFKDPQNLEEARYEVLVTPDSMNPVEWDFDPSTWLPYEPLTSYFVNYDKENSLEEDQIAGSRFHDPNWEARRFAADHDSDFDLYSDTDSSSNTDFDHNDETAITCIHCFSSHFDPCPRASQNAIILNQISSNGSINSDLHIQSILELESLSDSSIGSKQSRRSQSEEQLGRARLDLIQVVTEDRAHRLRDWTGYEQEIKMERHQFRQEEMMRGIRNIVEGQGESQTPKPLSGATLNHYLDDGPAETPTPGSSNFLMTVDPRLLKHQQGLEDSIEITPDSPLSSLHSLHGADAMQVLVQGELQEQTPKYLTSPILFLEDWFRKSLNEVLAHNIECELAEPPSPTDTDPVDHLVIHSHCQFPPLYVQPFVDNHLPNKIGNVHFKEQSFSHLGPHKNHSIPIELCTYYPYANSKVHFPD